MTSSPGGGLPPARGLYDPRQERESCGVGFIVSIEGVPSHKLIQDAETMSRRMEHRGACACDNNTGDGAGVMMAVPDKFYRKRLREELNVVLPPAGHYATGVCFLEQMTAPEAERRFEEEARANNLKVLCWRTLPTDDMSLGSVARSTEPYMRQVFVVPTGGQEGDRFKRDVFILRKVSSHKIPSAKLRYYICSLSADTIVYKGQLTTSQLWRYFVDLQDPECETYLALVHARFSTNTFPSWERAHPLRSATRSVHAEGTSTVAR